jgi:NAD(P)-dependent dehydrogenase (short-subunit alcohol dehydrogenase family)
MSLQGKVALVTGANRGIGLEIARQLGRAGVHVLMVSRNEANGREAVETLRGEGLSVELRVADVSAPSDVDRLAASITGPLHILVNNAGIIDEGVPTWDEPIEDWNSVIAVNLTGPFLMCRALVPLLRRTGWGRIVNVSSGMGEFSDGLDGGYPAYRVSKAGLNALTKNLAHELQQEPILVNAMCPGWVQTRMGGGSAPRTVEQGADTALYLASMPDGSPTGQFWRDRLQIDW